MTSLASAPDLASPRGEGGARERVLPWLELAALLVFAIRNISGYTSHVDIDVDDEIYYLAAGDALFAQGTLPDLWLAPPYSAALGLLSRVLPADVHPPDAMYAICAIATPVLLWWALRPLLPSPLGLLAATWLSASPVVLQAHGGAASIDLYCAALATFFAALGALARDWRWTAMILWIVGALIRPEMSPWFVVFAGAALAIRDGAWHGRFAKMAVVVAAGACAIVCTNAGVRARSWLAFEQHYARQTVLDELVAAQRATDLPLDPQTALNGLVQLDVAFAQPSPIVERDFPGAGSLSGALLTAPMRVLRFAATNVGNLPDALRRAWSTTLLPDGIQLGAVLLLAVAAAYGWYRFARGRSAWRAPRALVQVAVLSTPVAIAPSLLVAARPELVAVTVVIPILLIGGGLAALTSGRRAGTIAALAAPVLVVACSFACARPFDGPAAVAPQHRAAVQLLRDHPPAAGATVLCSAPFCYGHLCGRPGVSWTRLDALPKHTTFTELLAAGGIDHVLRSPDVDFRAAKWPDYAAALATWRILGHRDGLVLLAR